MKKASTWGIVLGSIAIFLFCVFAYVGNNKNKVTNKRIDSCATKADLAHDEERLDTIDANYDKVDKVLKSHGKELSEHGSKINTVINEELPAVSKNLAFANAKISKLNKQLAEIAHQDSIRHGIKPAPKDTTNPCNKKPPAVKK